MERLGELLLRIKQFNEEREWEQFHTPSNLAKSISIEANELLECFQWNDTEFNMDDVLEVRPRDFGANTCKHIIDKVPYLKLFINGTGS